MTSDTMKELAKLASCGELGHCQEAIVSITTYKRGDQGSVVHLTDERLMVYEVRLPTIHRLGACCSGELLKRLHCVVKLGGRWFVLQPNHTFDTAPSPPYQISLPENDPFVIEFKGSPVKGRFLVTFNKQHYMMTEDAFRSTVRAVESNSCTEIDKDLLKSLAD